MRRSMFLFVLIMYCAFARGQETLGGIINDYAAVNGYSCSNALLVDDASAFSAGDKILIVQMKGALIDETNSSAFGSITDYGSAGKYELNEVAYVESGALYLTYFLSNAYDFSEFVQVVRVPVFDDAIVDSTLTCKPWDGSTGGILALVAEGTLTLLADVDVSGKGFRGGEYENYPDSCPLGLEWTGYRTGIDTGNGAVKGEGIATVADGKRAGRGKLANGGGGGNDHNAGGGGGSMGGSGGGGGERIATLFSCPGSGVGISGVVPDNSNSENRIYPGGGGGAGHGNNGYSTAGGNGGGIVFITAASVDGNGWAIKSNGTSPETVLGDGGSGGGAAGSLYLDIAEIESDILLEAKGGDGSDITGDGCTGPGGGGGGGLLKFTGSDLPIGMITDLSGGIAGTTLTEESDCYGDSNGATDGAYGEIIYDWIPVESNALFTSDFAGEDFDTAVCFGNSVVLEAGGGVTYHWSPDIWLSNPDISNPLCSPEDSIAYSVAVTNLAGCNDTAVFSVNILPQVIASAGPDTSVCGPNFIQCYASGGTTYQWSPSTGVSDTTIPNPVIFATATGNYIVTVGNAGCIDADTVSIEVKPLPEVTASNDTTICYGTSVVLSADGALSYTWTPAPSIPCDICSSIEVMPLISTSFTVTGTNAEGCSDTASVLVTVEICDAIDDAKANQAVIFPNPVSSTLIIQFQYSLAIPVVFNIYSMDYRLVRQVELSAGNSEFIISLADLPAGAYVYSLRNFAPDTGGVLIKK